MQKQILAGKTIEELKELLSQIGMPSFSGGQMASWLYEKRVGDFELMTNISKSNRAKLDSHFQTGLYAPSQELLSDDGTIKYLFSLADGNTVETVFIPDKERATLCVSSQVGCKMNCMFCMTGKQGFQRNLYVEEIINQILSVPQSNELTNIVFMGMGEPMDNLDAVLKTIDILTSQWGLAWSPKRITVSTVGVKKGLRRFLDESRCHLAVSLHSPDGRRGSIIPADRSFSAADIIEMLRDYDFSHQRRLSFEYIMFAGQNDSLEDAEKLALLLKGLDCRVNLIRYHSIPGVPLSKSDENTMTAFRDALNSKGIIATIRASRGEDILAACGMLSSQKEKKDIINE